MADDGDLALITAPRRIEILTGGAERRRWPDALKVKILAESYAPGVVVIELARRHCALASQIHAWRKEVREGLGAFQWLTAFVRGAGEELRGGSVGEAEGLVVGDGGGLKIVAQPREAGCRAIRIP